jgi:hypothetical protein
MDAIGNSPSPAGCNGDRDAQGRFAKGNRSGRGNPLNRRAQKLRSTLLKSVKPSDLKKVLEKMIELATEGDVQAAKLIFDRIFGSPSQSVEAQVKSDVTTNTDWGAVRALREEMWRHPDYLDYLRKKAAKDGEEMAANRTSFQLPADGQRDGDWYERQA